MTTVLDNAIRFFAAGIPKGQPRPRAFARFIGGKAIARVYDAGSAEGWKSDIALAARFHRPAEPIAGPVRIEVEFLMPRPKSHFNRLGLKDSAPYWHIAKPDIDNALKAVCDALTTLRFWHDDAQVCALVSSRRYADPDVSGPGAWIEIHELSRRVAGVKQPQLVNGDPNADGHGTQG